jgi:hypothetical protein
MKNPIVVCYSEGGRFFPFTGNNGVVRIYSDRSVQDDIISEINRLRGSNIKRKRLSRSDFRRARKEAKASQKEFGS